MKFRYLIVDLDSGVAMGSNVEPCSELLADLIMVIIDTATSQCMNPETLKWEAIKDITEQVKEGNTNA